MSPSHSDDRPNGDRLMLFVADNEPHSNRATANLRRVLTEHLEQEYELEIVDVLKDYRRALDHNILVTPALVAVVKGRSTVILGDLSDEEQLLALLESTRPAKEA